MIKIYQLENGCNTYFVVKGDKAIVIDSGANAQVTMDYADKLGVEIIAQVFTHGHFDHTSAGAKLQKNGAKIYISEADAIMLNSDKNLASRFDSDYDYCTADYILKEGLLEIDGIKMQIIKTAGHTKGSICIVIDRNIFSGDTLFKHSVGRTDFEGGSSNELRKSLRKLFALSGDYTVYCGHMETTTLDNERKYFGL